MFVNQVKREQRVPQVVEDPEEQNDIKLLTKRGHIINGELAKLDPGAAHLRRKPGLRQVNLVEINRHDALGAAPFHFDGIEPAVAPDIQDRLALEIGRYYVSKALPLVARVVSQEMVRCGLHPAQIQVVKPLAQFRHTGANMLAIKSRN